MDSAAALLFLLLLGTCQAMLDDFRTVSYEEILQSVETFQSPDVKRFGELLFDIPHYQLIVGARDYLFRLSLEGLGKLEEAPWPAETNTKTICMQKGQSEADCRNFIKVLLSHNNKIFTCGTNAFSPECTWREVNALNSVTKWVNGVARCPYSPHFNSSALITVSGDYYIASALDFSARDPAIHRITLKNESSLRTVQFDPKWLSGPDFVGSIEISNFTYFFFREEAVEYLNCGKAVYSRVARMCKNDHGGRYMLKDNWTTFLKARLNCSVSGAKQTFYYDQIQSLHYLEHQQMIYATFNTPDNSIYGGAVCAYNLSSIARAFSGPFKYQSSSKAAWEKSNADHRHFQCDSDKPLEQEESASLELDSQRYQLMWEAVQSAYQHPVYTVELQRLHHIVVDVVSTKHEPDGVHVVFVSTVEGVLRKLVVLPQKWTSCLVEEIHLFPENSTGTIHTMKILKDVSSLYLGTEDSVIRVQLHRCKRYSSKEACLKAMDPYCGWNEHQLACTTAPHRNPQNTNWLQDRLTECPGTKVEQDGGWSLWSKWSDCGQTGSDITGDRCLCRHRECNSPKPSNGGKPCSGIAMEVANCTRNGQWTEWSSWSACSASCGTAVKTRRRSCGNPAPAFGGRVCVGPERDEVYCMTNPPCPIDHGDPVDGQFSEWGTWEECSQPCGGGIQYRRRKCNSPEPRGAGKDCNGCHEESRWCNIHRCSEVRKNSPWSPWLRVNRTKEGFFEQRFRFTCRADVPSAAHIHFTPIRKEERFCTSDNHSCLDSAFANIDGEWSEWSSWSHCSVSCGSGIEFRERSCDNPRPAGSGDDCQGVDREERECNVHSCHAVWSCWSDFSACSISCGVGQRVRTRHCLDRRDYLSGGRGCEGHDKELASCYGSSCNQPENGWLEWSVWSLCDTQRQREQHRRRVCSRSNPSGSICQGHNKESRLCVDTQILDSDPNLLESRTAGLGSNGIHVQQVLISAVIGFVVGCLAMFTVYYLWRYRKHRRQGKKQMIPFRRSKPNHYVPESDYKNNFNAANDFKPKEATIKRNGGSILLQNSHTNSNRTTPIRESIRANLEIDQNF